jgi:hypothetical protein
MTFGEWLVTVKDDTKPVEQLLQDAWDAAVEQCAKMAESVVDCDCLQTVGFCECYGATTLLNLAVRIRETQ